MNTEQLKQILLTNSLYTNTTISLNKQMLLMFLILFYLFISTAQQDEDESSVSSVHSDSSEILLSPGTSLGYGAITKA